MLECIHLPNAFPTSSNQPGAKEAHFWVVSSFEEMVPVHLTCLSEMLPPSDNSPRVKQSCVTIYVKYHAALIPSLPSLREAVLKRVNFLAWRNESCQLFYNYFWGKTLSPMSEENLQPLAQEQEPRGRCGWLLLRYSLPWTLATWVSYTGWVADNTGHTHSWSQPPAPDGVQLSNPTPTASYKCLSRAWMSHTAHSY